MAQRPISFGSFCARVIVPRARDAHQDTVYKYPDMSVCLNGLFGCDEFFLAETCAKSSNTTEGGAPRATFIYDWFGQQEVSSSVEQSLDGVSERKRANE